MTRGLHPLSFYYGFVAFIVLQLEVEVNELREKLSKQTQGTPDNSLLR